MELLSSIALYNILRGPLVWITFIVFIGGCTYRVKTFIDLVKEDKTILPFPICYKTLEIETCVYNYDFPISHMSGFYSHISSCT